MENPQFVEQANPEEVFTALSDDTRIAILQALWDADDSTASFSELRDTVGMRDSGQFNYHLNKLVGRFVAKMAEGYELTQAGKQIIGAIEAGAYTMEGTIKPIPLTEPCPACGGTRTLHYENETVQIECDSCLVGYQFGAPPAAFAGYDREAIPTVASQYLRTTIQHLNNSFCVFCDGRVQPKVGPVHEIEPAEDSPDEVPEEVSDTVVEQIEKLPLVEYACQQCGVSPTAGLNLALHDHPAVVGFYYEHGIDVQEQSVWEFADLNPDHQRIRRREPLRASVTYEIDEDELTVVVDENLNITEIET